MPDFDDMGISVETARNIMIGFGLALAVALVWFFLAWPAFAHIHDRPDLDTWTQSLHNAGHGWCCDSSEATVLADVDWRNTQVDQCKRYSSADGDDQIGHLCVRVEGDWWLVADSKVINEPNRYGMALLWGLWIGDGPGRQYYVRCFLPGVGA